MVNKFLFLGLWAVVLISGFDCAPAPQSLGDNGDAPGPGAGYGNPYGKFGFPFYAFNPYFGSFGSHGGPPGGPQTGPQGGPQGGGMPYGMSFSPFGGMYGPYGPMGPGFGGPGPFFGPPPGKIPPGKTFGPPPHVFTAKFPFWANPGYTGPQPGAPQ